jgi:hypothetical protein
MAICAYDREIFEVGPTPSIRRGAQWLEVVDVREAIAQIAVPLLKIKSAVLDFAN